MLTSKEKQRAGMLDNTLKSERLAGTQSAMVLEKPEDGAEGWDTDWLEYAEWYHDEMRHPLLKHTQLNQTRHENMLRALLLKKLEMQQDK